MHRLGGKSMTKKRIRAQINKLKNTSRLEIYDQQQQPKSKINFLRKTLKKAEEFSTFSIYSFVWLNVH